MDHEQRERARADFIARGREFARRNPDNTDHARVLALVDPEFTPPVTIPPGRTLDLTAARASLTAASSSPALAAASSSPPTAAPAAPASRPLLLDVGAVRRRQAAEAAARRPPACPPGALRFVAGDYWRWCQVESALPNARGWLRLASSLVSAGPLLSLDVRRGAADGDGGHSRFHYGDGGHVWASVVIDPAACGSPHRTERVLAHELAHVGDELARLQTVTAAAWWRDFRDPHRERQAEEFAVSAEEWLTPRTTAAEVLAAARAHQGGRRVR